MTKKIKTFEQHLEEKYGKRGTESREDFDSKSKAFMIGEMLKEARITAKMTQSELAEKTGTKKSYISRLENGKVDIQLSTMYKLFEEGLNKKISIGIK